MAVFFVDNSGGNDGNDGLDNIGVGLATATWTESTFTLTQAGHGYTFATGDVIYLASGTGLTPGLYEVASTTTNDIVLVETSSLRTVGNASDVAAGDLASGDIVSSDGPDATIAAGLSAVAAGDHLWVRAGTSYNEALVPSTVGTAGAPIVVEGYTTTLGDEGIVVNDGTSGTLARGCNPLAGSNYYVWRNMRFTVFSAVGFGDLTADYITLYKVECDNCGGGGFELDDHCMLAACHAHDNTGDGFSVGSLGHFYKCISQNNTGDGFQASAGMYVIECLAYENGGNGVNWTGSGVYGLFLGNTIVSDSGGTNKGMSLNPSNTANKYLCINNTVSGYSGGGGVGIACAVIKDRAFMAHNNVYDCETDFTPATVFDLSEGFDADPAFVDEVGLDFTPETGSALIETGLDVSDCPNADTQTTQTATVGALLQATVVGGGGGSGVLVHPGTSGGARA